MNSGVVGAMAHEPPQVVCSNYYGRQTAGHWILTVIVLVMGSFLKRSNQVNISINTVGLQMIVIPRLDILQELATGLGGQS